VQPSGGIFGDDDVRGLQIAVDDASIVRGGQTGTDLGRDGYRFGQWQRPVETNPIRQGLPGGEFHDEEPGAVVLFQAMKLGDVLMRQLCEQLRLPAEPPEALHIGGERCRQHFDGDLAPQPGVLGQVDLTHTALAELVENAVRA